MDVTVDGKLVHAATGGRALNPNEPAVVLVHGAGLDRTIWQLQTRNIANRGRRTFAIDLPGHGRSEGPALTEIGEIADWLARFMSAAGVETATVIGHSMGALVALEMAARFPDRVDKLCLMGVAEKMPVHPDLLAAAEKNQPLAAELIVYWGLGEKAQIGGHPLPGLWVHQSSQVLLEKAPANVLFGDLTACNGYASAIEAAARVTCPTVLVLGRDDKMTPIKKARPLAEAIADQRTVIIEKCGHMVMSERPNQVFDALKGFVF